MVCLFSLETAACKCQEVTTEQKVNRSDFIYIGQIVSSKLVGDKEILSDLKVIEVLKGAPETTQFISRVETHMCAMYAATGLSYVVFGNYGSRPKLTLCSDTQPLARDRDPKYNEKLNELRQKYSK